MLNETFYREQREPGENDGGATEAVHCSIPRREQRGGGFISIAFAQPFLPSRIAINLGGGQGRRALHSRITIKCLTPKLPLLRQLGRSSLNLLKYFMCVKPPWTPRSGVRRIRIGRGGALGKVVESRFVLLGAVQELWKKKANSALEDQR